MVVLYNGEYTEYDVTTNPNWKHMLKIQEESYSQWIGRVYGDFEIIKIEFDWYLSAQRALIKCVHCGEEKFIKSPSDFRRGKGASQKCECQKPKKTKGKETKDISEEYRSRVGETVSGFKLLDYKTGRGFRVECVECGKQKWASGKSIFDGRVECNHKIVTDYSDPKYIGMKVGSLTAIAREGNKIRFRCDCGKESVRKPSEVFGEKGVRSCGKNDCVYHNAIQRGGHDKRIRGLVFERKCADTLEKQGFVTEMTPSTGDYGVDFFAMVDGERVAFQCKLLKTESMVSAVQEVYAGGRYYDCCKFVVVSPSGFTYAAELMAYKLGVQLEKSLDKFRLKPMGENRIETRKIKSHSGNKTVWEIDGVLKSAEEWCREYGISRTTVLKRMRQGCDLKTALTKPKYEGKHLVTIDGVTKSKKEWCDEYGISPQAYDYRVKYSGLTPKEALTKEVMVKVRT